MLDLARLSSYYTLVKDLMTESIRVDAPGLARRLREAFLNALDDGCEHVSCMTPFARRLLDDYPELRRRLEEAIGRWGAVFIRGDGASPKDACGECYLGYEACIRAGIHPVPETVFNACLATRPESAIALLVASERVHVIGEADVVWLRKPALLDMEARIFVWRGSPRLVTQYYYMVPVDPDRFLRVVMRYLDDLLPRVSERLARHGVNDYVVDAALHHGRPVLVELTPFPPSDNARRVVGGVDTILFDEEEFWEQLERATENNLVIVRLTAGESREREYAIRLDSAGRGV